MIEKQLRGNHSHTSLFWFSKENEPIILFLLHKVKKISWNQVSTFLPTSSNSTKNKGHYSTFQNLKGNNITKTLQPY